MSCANEDNKRFPPSFVEGFHYADSIKKMIYKQLGKTGLQISFLALGASAAGNIYGKTNEEEAIITIREAIKLGINYIDTAPWYGQGKSEEVLGKALQNVPRNSYYIATKVGRYDLEPQSMFDFSYERTIRSVNESLKRLNLDYVDVIQVHDLEFASDLSIILLETLPALMKIKEEGKAHFVGITGYPLTALRDCLENSSLKIDTVLSYCRYSLNNSDLQDYFPFLQSKQVGIINAAPLGMGLLTVQGPPHWHPAHRDIKTACSNAVQFCQEQNVDISKLALKYSLLQEAIDTTLVSIASQDVLNKNLQTALEPLTNYEENILKEVQKRFFDNLHINHWEFIEFEKYGLFKKSKSTPLKQ